ncbi:MAG: DUF58 domain-containing protein [Azospirillaceae bacterium]|nr:DUF58 domain-containing protein [Azospirillaceae bacterium]
MATSDRTLPFRQRAEALAARLPPLLAAAQRVAATVAQGVHGRRRIGTGEAFWEFRPYDPADPAQKIDWRQSAKSQNLYVRETEWEAAQSLWLWHDRTASMAWRSAPTLPTKRERSDLLTLALAVLLVRGGERVALLGSDRPPASGSAVLERLATTMSGQQPPGSALPTPQPLPRFAQVVLIGDLLAPLDQTQAVVAALLARGVRGHLLQVLDPAEEALPYDGRVRFAGLEGEDAILVPRVEDLRPAYRVRMQAHRDGLAAIARAAGWSYACHHTDRPPQAALLTLYAAVSRHLTA